MLAVPLAAQAPVSAQELFQKGQAAEATGYLNLAIHYYTHALKAQNNTQARRILAKVMEKAGHRGLAELEWRKILAASPGDSEATAAVAALSAPGAGPVQDESLEALQPPAKADMIWTKGHGVWVYGEPRQWVAKINEYNLSAPRTQRIKYVFPISGSLGFNGGAATLSWNSDRVVIMGDSLQGEARAYAMIDGQSAGLASIREAEWDRVAQEIAEKLNADERIAGVQFDIEPHDPKLHALYARVKKYTAKPVGAALSVWEMNTFKFLDFVVLMAYDHAVRPSDYGAAVRDQVRAFLRDARNAETKVLIGAPAIATHHEYEGTSDSPEKTPVGSGFKMSEYVDFLRRAVSMSIVTDDPSYLGLSIWALHPEGGLHQPGDQLYYYPTSIDPALWESFKLPLSAEEQ